MAIGAVTETLKSRIATLAGIPDISIGRPDESKDSPAGGVGGARLNLFLYEIHLDEHLKNTPLNEGEKPPLWLVLKYMVTAFNTEASNDVAAQKSLGAAMLAVSRNDLFRMDLLVGDPLKALPPNPEQLHVTFDEASSDLLSKLMQGTDEKYRLSFCFQVRPVMIAAAEPGEYSLLVGVDYTKPPVTLADPYVGIDVIPSMGSYIEDISPRGFELGEEVTLRGMDMHLANLSVMLGSVELPVVMQRPDELRFRVDHAIIEASGISAGSYPVTVAQTLPGTGKKRKSNAVIGNLVPTLNTVAIGAAVIDIAGPPIESHRDFDLAGTLLGINSDDTILAFYRNGAVLKMFDVFTPLPSPSPPGQLTRQLVLKSDDGIPAGDYNMILIVNGQQAPQSPKITLPVWP